MKWITKEMALAFHDRQLAEHGGQPGLRDEGLLESALARPHQLFTYGDPPPDIIAIAASYAHGLAKNHPFLDGNKRTAHVVYRVFLRLNGIEVTATKEDLFYATLALAAGEHDEETFTAWLCSVTAEYGG